MPNKDNGGPAFPQPDEQVIYNENQGWMGARGYGEFGSPGMTLRDYFAAKCDISQYAPGDLFYRTYGRNPDASERAALIAELRFIEADAMLAARSA